MFLMGICRAEGSSRGSNSGRGNHKSELYVLLCLLSLGQWTVPIYDGFFCAGLSHTYGSVPFSDVWGVRTLQNVCKCMCTLELNEVSTWVQLLWICKAVSFFIFFFSNHNPSLPSCIFLWLKSDSSRKCSQKSVKGNEREEGKVQTDI